jgi:hypothetical protein
MIRETGKGPCAKFSQTPRHGSVCGNGGIAPSFLTSTLGGSEYSFSQLGLLIPGERAPSIH